MTDTKDQLRALRERRLKAIGKETRMATEYVLLEKTGDGDWALSTKTYKATSAKAAIRQALAGENGTAGVFVAIPHRSWQPVEVKVETALKFS